MNFFAICFFLLLLGSMFFLKTATSVLFQAQVGWNEEFLIPLSATCLCLAIFLWSLFEVVRHMLISMKASSKNSSETNQSAHDD